MKTDRLLLLVAVILAVFALPGCVEKNYYNSNPPNNTYYNNNNNDSGYTYVYNVQFNYNGYGWTFTDPTDSAYSAISNGLYQYVDYSATKSNMSVSYTQANTSGNFTVQTKIESNKIMGLIFGASTTDNGYAFYIDTAGNYSLYKEGNDSVASTVIIASTADTPTALKDNWNTLEMDQINGVWTGYINGVQTFTLSARSLSGAGFGFKILPGTIGYVADLIVKSH